MTIALKRLPVKHIGNISALCNKKLSAGLREDLDVDRYRQLGVKERFRDEKPYRICERCIRCVSVPWWRK